MNVAHNDPDALQDAIDIAVVDPSVGILQFMPSPTFATDGFDYQVRGELLVHADLCFLGSPSAGRRIVIKGSGTHARGGILNIDTISSGGPQDVNILIENLVFTGGQSVQSGGAINYDSGGSLTLENCRIENCNAAGAGALGGGVCFGFDVSNGALSFNIISCEFESNTAVRGGAIFGGGGHFHVSPLAPTPLNISGTVANPTIIKNNLANSGGGIDADFMNVHIAGAVDGNGNFGVEITDNQAVDGGGIALVGAGLLAEEALMAHNTAIGAGGGVQSTRLLGFGLVLEIGEGSRVSSNEALGTGGGGLFVEDDSQRLEIDSAAVIEGNSADNGSGGGIYIQKSLSVFIDGTIENNSAGAKGGGVFVEADPDIAFDPISAGLKVEGLFKGNGATEGGGLFSQASLLILEGAIFDGNFAFDNGGGVGLSDRVFIIDTQFIGNFATNGGGISSRAPSHSLIGTTFEANVAVSEGGGLHIDGGTLGGSPAQGFLTETQFSSNHALQGGGMFIVDSDLLIQANSNFNGNSALASGGGIAAISSEISINSNGAFALNTAGLDGGGISLFNSDLNFLGQTTTMLFNSAGSRGGAIFSGDSAVTFSGGAGIFANSAQNGGGIFTDAPLGGNATMTNPGGFGLSIIGNTATQNGGGIFDSGLVELEDFVFTTSGNNPDQIFRDFGAGTLSIAITDPCGFEALNQGAFVDLGDWIVGSSGTPQTFRIFNNGNDPLRIFDVQISGSATFALDASAVGADLQPGESTTFTVSFSPGIVGSEFGEVTVISDDPDDIHFEIPIFAQGVLEDDMAQDAYVKASNSGTGDNFGNAVSISGMTYVVGASSEDSDATGVDGDELNDLAPDAGAAYVFTCDINQTAQQAYLKASNTEAGDAFGNAVAISGDTIVVGARWEDSGTTVVDGDELDNSAVNSGAAYVFVRDTFTGEWEQEAYLKASNAEAGDEFGYSVGISGDTIVVGAVREDSSATGVDGDGSSNTSKFAGAAYVFVRNASQEWSQQAYLKASNTGKNDSFGFSSAISSDLIVIGATGEDSSATGINGDGTNNSAGTAGAAYVFRRQGVSWAQEAYLKASNTEAGDRYGVSVSISGDSLVVGAAWEDGVASGVNGDEGNGSHRTGAAYVYDHDGTNWSQGAYVKASTTGVSDFFGHYVSISGDAMMIGAVGEDSSATGINGSQTSNGNQNSGAAYLFIRTAGTWSQHAYIKASNTGTSDFFGRVGISGSTAIIGSILEDSNESGMGGTGSNNSATNAGAVYEYDLFSN